MSDAQNHTGETTVAVVETATENNTAPVETTAVDTAPEAEAAPVVTIESLTADITACIKEISQAAANNIDLLPELVAKRKTLDSKLVELQNENLKPLVAQLMALGKSGLELHNFAVSFDKDYKRQYGHQTLDTASVQAEIPGMETGKKAKKGEGEGKPRAKSPFFFEVKVGDKVHTVQTQGRIAKEIDDLRTAQPTVNFDRFNNLRLAGDARFQFAVLRKGGNKNNIDDVWSGIGFKPKWVSDAINAVASKNADAFKGKQDAGIKDMLLAGHEVFKDHVVVLTDAERASIKFPNIDNTWPKAK